MQPKTCKNNTPDRQTDRRQMKDEGQTTERPTDVLQNLLTVRRVWMLLRLVERHDEKCNSC